MPQPAPTSSIADLPIRNPQSAIRNPIFRLLIPICFLLMLLVSWRRWTSLIVDTGREMDLPVRLLRGELLYRDIHYLYPPLSPYFNALLYRLFGTHLEVLNVSGVICALVIVALCYRIARRVLAEREAVLATLAVIVWCIFKPEGNLIAPYAFAALHGMIFALGTLLVTLRYNEHQKWREVVLAGVLIGLAGITKQEFALTAVVTWCAGIFFIYRRDWKGLLTRLFVPAIISITIALPVYVYFLSRVGWQTLIEDCHLLYTKIPASLVYYNSARTGLDQPFSSLLQMLGGVAVGLGLASLIVLLSTVRHKAGAVGCPVQYGERERPELRSESLLNKAQVAHAPRTASSKLRWKAALSFLLCAVFAISVHLLSRGRWDGSPLRALPFALVGLMLFHFFYKNEAKPQFALFVIAVYSLMALIRVVFRVPSGGAFGGYFLPTSLILIVYLTLEAFPRFIEQFYDEYATEHFPPTLKTFAIKPRLRFIGTLLLSLWLLATIVVFGYRYRRTFPVLLTAPQGSLYVTAETAQAANEAIAFLLTNSAPDDAVAILPEGSSLAFLTGRRMPLRHQIFIPDFMDQQEEQRAIAALAKVKYVLLINRPMREFGLEAFGRDYYQAMGQAIEEQFRVVKVCGAVKDESLSIGYPRFFIKILQRR